MTDRELLEMAAKAVGFKWVSVYDCWYDSNTHYDHWNPLTDDGDALRLAVKLKLLVNQDDGGVYVSGEIPSLREEYGNDPYAATRRAIVRAAAEIGKSM